MNVRSSLASAVLLSTCGLGVPALAQPARWELRAGRQLTPEEVASMEQRLAENPHDLAAKIRLIGYYLAQRSDRDARERRVAHVLWLTGNEPDTDALAAPEGRISHILDADASEEARAEWPGRIRACGRPGNGAPHPPRHGQTGAEQGGRQISHRRTQEEPDSDT